MVEQLILIGGGGHCASCIDVIEQEKKYSIAGIVDTKDKIGQKVWGHEVIADDTQLPELTDQYQFFLITIGQIKTAEKRKKIFEILKNHNACLPTIISPHAYVSYSCTIGEGSIIHHQTLLNSGVVIGANCIINSKSLLEHDVRVGDHTHISTGTLINGDVKIGKESFIGSGAVIKQGIEIGKNSIIGMGAHILKSTG